MRRTLIFATSSAHKISEVQAIVGDRLEILSLADVGHQNLILEETADTLHGNAQQKTQILYDLVEQDCFAEDTGLEVDALNGAPGVFTARYSGVEDDPSKNINKLLHELTGITHRKARFRTVIALIINRALYFFEGSVEGTIAERPGGSGGFGYDPVFIPAGYTQTFAELSPEVKNALSHRSQAVHKMLAFLISGTHK